MAIPGGTIQLFWEPVVDDIEAPAVGLEGDGAHAADAVDDDERLGCGRW